MKRSNLIWEACVLLAILLGFVLGYAIKTAGAPSVADTDPSIASATSATSAAAIGPDIASITLRAQNEKNKFYGFIDQGFGMKCIYTTGASQNVITLSCVSFTPIISKDN